MWNNGASVGVSGLLALLLDMMHAGIGTDVMA
jgi:hypothetical protein